MSKTYKPLVSVIIACKNNEKYIRQSLESVKAQTYTNWEMIIVDNFSTDKTFEIAKEYTDKVYQLGPERSTQFNFGFTKSKGELIYRIGAEFKLNPDVIQKCVDVIALGFHSVAVHNRSVGDSVWAKVRYLERESYKGDDTVVAVRFFKREAFETIDGFDESLVANEDFDLHNRMERAGYKWSHVDAVEDHLGEPANIGEVWNKFYYYGRTIGNYMKKSKSNSKHIKIMRPSYNKFYSELVKQPKLFVAFYIYMATKFIAGGLGYLRGVPKELKK
jgi:glycosyltransferase involved in cell wall biosynthesis